jgi:hypothetical protein
MPREKKAITGKNDRLTAEALIRALLFIDPKRRNLRF